MSLTSLEKARYVPSGCPSLASDAPLTKTGIEDSKPRIVVDGSVPDKGRRTLGSKKNRENARAFSCRAEMYAVHYDACHHRHEYILISSSAPAE